jgi:predicted phage terminase large subunit-like protein
MVMRLVEGDTAFFLEKQNEPLGDARYLFDLEAAAYCTITPMGIVRAGGTLVPWGDVVALAMALDPTPDKQDIQGSDYAACPVVAQDRDGYLYVLDCYLAQEQSTQRQILAIVDLMWRWDVKLLGIESNNFASLLVSDIREAIKQRAMAEKTPEFDAMLISLVNMRNKIQRIKTLEPLLANGWLQLNKTLPAQYLQQFREFLPLEGAGHDDGPDATEMAIRTVRHMWERRDIT